jgi:RNA polymerase sigma-70 factor (ECF subfamily)
MDPDGLSERLSQITTQWTLLQQAHAGPAGGAPEAQRRLMQRYCGAVYRYLLGALRDQDAALELFQEFALRFVRGDFRRAAAGHGRFRDYVKAALRNLVTDYHRQRQSGPQPLPADVAAPAAADEDEFMASWREELVSQTWAALAEAQPVLHAALRAHAQHPDAPAARLAEELAAGLGKPVTAGNVRVMLHRARARFAELLVAEVAHSLGEPSEAELREELRALGLLKLCGPALGRQPRDGE